MIMATSLLLGACNPATDVNVKETGDKNLIGKSDIRIKDGRMTPEALWAMGRIGGMNVSPDGKKVVYTVAYYSVPENKSNREVFAMNADGSDNKQITKTGFAENEAVWIKGGTKIAFLCNERIRMGRTVSDFPIMIRISRVSLSLPMRKRSCLSRK